MLTFSHSSSAEFAEARCRDADVRLISLDRQMSIRERTVEMSRCAVGMYATESRILVDGGAAGNSAVVMLITNNDSESIFAGEPVQKNDVLIFGPGSSHFVHGGRRGTISLFFRADELQRQLNSLLCAEAPDIRGRRLRLRLPEQDSRSLDLALHSPWTDWAAGNVATPSLEEIDRWQSAFFGRVCEIVSRNWRPRDAPESRARREAILKASRDLIIAKPEETDLTAICECIGYSAETIRLVFREFLGTTPMKYANAYKLHACREALRDADPRLVTVKCVARRFGITGNLGRFASAYRTAFGELPSETIIASSSTNSLS
jgi:methylphosphotriester-DNA--protein-cysteine methyltransferase